MRWTNSDGFWIGIFSAVWALWLTTPHIIRGPLSYVKVHCNNDSYTPRLYWYAEHAREKLASLLEPVMCTTDRVVDFGMPTLFDMAAIILPVPLVYFWLMWLQRFIAVFFTTVLMINIFKVPRLLALLTGVLFSFGFTRGERISVEWIYVHFLHEPGLPLLLYIVCCIQLKNLWHVCFCGLLLGTFVATTSQVDIGPFFTLPCAFLFALIAREDIVDWKSLNLYILFALSIILGFTVYQFPHLWAVLLNNTTSARSVIHIEPRDFIDGFNLFIFRFQKMWPQFLLCCYWLLLVPKKRRPEWALFILIFITTVAGTMLRPLLFRFYDHFPIAGSYNFDRLFLYAPFFWLCSAILTVRTFQFPSIVVNLKWRSINTVLPSYSIFTMMIFILILNWSFTSIKIQWKDSLAMDRLGEHWHRFFQNPELKALAEEIGESVVRTVTVGAEDSPLAWQPSFNLAYGLETADGYKMIYPWRFHQFWRLVVDPAYNASDDNLTRRFLDVDASRMYIFPPRNKNAILPPDYNFNLLSLSNVGFFISNRLIDDDRIKLRSPVFTDELFSQWIQEPLHQKIIQLLNGTSYLGPRLYIYENPLVFSRFRLVSNLIRYADEDELLGALAVASISDFEQSVYALESDTSSVPLPESGGTVTVNRYSVEDVELTTTSSGRSILTVANTYSKYWTCTVDDEKYNLFPVYHLFMGVSIPPGTHRIKLIYNPPYRSMMKVMF